MFIAIFAVSHAYLCETNRQVHETAGGFNLALNDVHNISKSSLAGNKDIRLQQRLLQRDAVADLDTVRKSGWLRLYGVNSNCNHFSEGENSLY